MIAQDFPFDFFDVPGIYQTGVGERSAVVYSIDISINDDGGSGLGFTSSEPDSRVLRDKTERNHVAKDRIIEGFELEHTTVAKNVHPEERSVILVCREHNPALLKRKIHVVVRTTADEDSLLDVVIIFLVQSQRIAEINVIRLPGHARQQIGEIIRHEGFITLNLSHRLERPSILVGGMVGRNQCV